MLRRVNYTEEKTEMEKLIRELIQREKTVSREKDGKNKKEVKVLVINDTLLSNSCSSFNSLISSGCFPL